MTRIYAACLASYNNGRLHGEWIEVSADVDEMQEAVAKMLLASPYPNVTVDCPECEVGRRGIGVAEGKNFTGYYICSKCDGYGKLPSAEEWAVHDYDDADNLISDLGETSDLKAIAFRVEVAELADDELGDDGREIVAMYWEYMGASYMPKDASEAVEYCREAYQGTYDSLEEWAEQWLEDTGALAEVPASLRNYIDFEAWARDAVLGGDVFTVRTGGQVHIFNNH